MFPRLRKLARVFIGVGSGLFFGVAVGIAMNNLAIGIAIVLVFGTGAGAAWKLKQHPKKNQRVNRKREAQIGAVLAQAPITLT